MLYPLPAVLVSTVDKEGKPNIFTAAWTGTVCTNPPMVYISVRPSRYSCENIRNTGEFVINLTTEELTYAADYCGVRSGRDVDKFKQTHLTPDPSEKVVPPGILESPVSIECRVNKEIPLGSHIMFLADVLAVRTGEELLDQGNKLHLDRAGLMVYSHGDYLLTGKKLGTFGYSVKKRGQKNR